MSSPGPSATPSRASRSAAVAALSRTARSAGRTAVSRPPRTTATSRAPAGPGISIRTASGRRKAMSAAAAAAHVLALHRHAQAARPGDARPPRCSATPGGGRWHAAGGAGGERAAARRAARLRAWAASRGCCWARRAPWASRIFASTRGRSSSPSSSSPLSAFCQYRRASATRPRCAEDVAEVIEDHRVVAVPLEGAAHRLLRRLEPVEPVERPAQAVLVGRAAGGRAPPPSG